MLVLPYLSIPLFNLPKIIQTDFIVYLSASPSPVTVTVLYTKVAFKKSVLIVFLKPVPGIRFLKT